MSFASSSFIDSKSTINESGSKTTSAKGGGGIMSALYSKRQSEHQTQQLAMRQREDREEEDAIMRYHLYQQQHQQQHHQIIPQAVLSAKPAPPSITNYREVELRNNYNSNNPYYSNDNPTTIVTGNQNLSTGGIPEIDDSPRIARVDFAGGITTAADEQDVEEEFPATAAWQHFFSSSIATATTNATNAIKAATYSPTRANSANQTPAPTWNPSADNNNNGGAIASSAPPRTSKIPKPSTASTSSTNSDAGSALFFAPDIVVGIGGNTKITDSNRAKYHGRTAGSGISYFPMQSPSKSPRPPPSSKLAATRTNAPSYHLDQRQQKFQQEQVHLQQPPPRPQHLLPSMSSTNRRHGDHVRFQETDDETKGSDPGGETKTMDLRSTFLAKRQLSTVQEGVPKEGGSKSSPNLTSKSQRTPSDASDSKLKMAARKNERLESRRPAPPPPPGPELTYWGKKKDKLEQWWRKPPKYRALKTCQLICGAYIVLMSFTYIGSLGNVGGLVDRETGWIIDPSSPENTERGLLLVNGDFRAVVAQSNFQMVALAISRLSAFTMYPALVVVFTSKFRGTMNFLSHTYLGQFFLASDLHDIHVYCGHYILVDGCLHSIFHTARWAAQGNLTLLIKNPSGISGLIVIGSTLLICLPMMFGKKKVVYEIRKGIHYLFLVFALAMCFHVPTSGFPNGGFAPYVFGTLLVGWFLDNLFVQWFLTEKIQSSHFYVLPSGVQLTMAVSERFQSWGTGGYCYVCFPWVNLYQWHAFSLFENPTEPSQRQIFMQKLGDWTGQVHGMLGRETSRPVWIAGPFTSPYGNADSYDNQILVAGGIGITPALSVIRQLKDTRRCNLIWATRDRHMLEFFIKHADLSHRGWNLVFYTGKENLLGIEDVVVTGSGATIHIIRQRPKLHFVIPNLIYGIESGTSKPEQFVPDDKIVAMELLQEKLVELEQDPALDSHEKMSELVNYCDELGYLFSDLISTIPDSDLLTKTQRTIGNKSNRSVLDAILHFDGSRVSQSPDVTGDRRGMFANQRGPMSSRNMLVNASRRKLTGLGSAGVRRRRSSSISVERISSGGRRRSSGDRSRESITTGTWGVLAASLQVKNQLKNFDFDGSDEEDDTVDVEAANVSSMFDEFPFKPWEYNEEAENYVNKMKEEELSTWGVLYCGGKSPLYRALKKAAREANVEMHEESFAW